VHVMDSARRLDRLAEGRPPDVRVHLSAIGMRRASVSDQLLRSPGRVSRPCTIELMNQPQPPTASRSSVGLVALRWSSYVSESALVRLQTVTGSSVHRRRRRRTHVPHGHFPYGRVR
jgi:hypothetical protein